MIERADLLSSPALDGVVLLDVRSRICEGLLAPYSWQAGGDAGAGTTQDG